MTIEKNEVLRYMKILPERCTPELEEQIAQAEDELSRIIRPRRVWKEFPCIVEGMRLQVGNMQVASRSLSSHLAGCSRAVLMAATLGHEVDQLLRRLSLTDMGKGVVCQAVSVAMIEAYCDEIEAGIKQDAARRGYAAKWRFSPGYGDFAIEHQRDFFSMLDCQKHTGMTLTDTCMMNPVKSVTAIIGLYKKDMEKQ